MPAENKWNDALGKRLYDFEEEPLPETWPKISDKLKPRRYRWWFWLPLLPLLISLPWLVKNPGLRNAAEDRNQQTKLQNENSISVIKPKPHTGTLQPEQKPGNIALNQPAPVSAEELTSEPNPQINSGKSNLNTAGDEEKNIPPTRQSEQQGYRPIIVTPGIAAVQETEEPGKVNSAPEKQKKKTLPQGLIARTRQQKAWPDKAAKSLIPAGSTNKTAVPVLKEKPENNLYAGASGQPAIAFKGKAGKNQAGKDLNGSPEAQKTLAGTANTVPEVNSGYSETGATPQDQKSSLDLSVAFAPEQNAPAKQDSVLNQISDAIPLAQDSTENKAGNEPGKATGKWAFIVHGAPQIAYQQVFANRQDYLMVSKMNHLNTYSSERFGYELGIRSRYYLSEKIQLEAGFHFGQLKQTINITTMATQADSAVVQQQPNGNITMQVYNRQQNQQFVFQYYLGGAYLGANYVLLPKLHFQAGSGASTVFKYKNETKGLKAEITDVLPYLAAGFKYNWQPGRKVTLQAGPVMQYYLQAFQRGNAPVTAKPVTFGFSIGMQYRNLK